MYILEQCKVYIVYWNNVGSFTHQSVPIDFAVSSQPNVICSFTLTTDMVDYTGSAQRGVGSLGSLPYLHRSPEIIG